MLQPHPTAQTIQHTACFEDWTVNPESNVKGRLGHFPPPREGRLKQNRRCAGFIIFKILQVLPGTLHFAILQVRFSSRLELEPKSNRQPSIIPPFSLLSIMGLYQCILETACAFVTKATASIMSLTLVILVLTINVPANSPNSSSDLSTLGAGGAIVLDED